MPPSSPFGSVSQTLPLSQELSVIRPSTQRELLRKTGLHHHFSQDDDITASALIKLRCGEITNSIMKDADLNLSEHKRWYLERVSEKMSYTSQNMIRAASELYERTVRHQVSPITQIMDLMQSKMLDETLVALAFNFT